MEKGEGVDTKKNSVGRFLAILFFCFVSSFFGSWVFISSGLVSPDKAINTTNSTTIVTNEEKSTSRVAEKMSPSVVSITTTTVKSNGYQQMTSQGAGTGVIISKDGYILTNKHVASGASDFSVVTSEGHIYDDVTFVGADPLNDLAFIKINDSSEDLIPADLGDSFNLRIGQKVLAIGNALGEYQNSVTSGIISGKGRPIVADDGTSDGASLENLLQTDAAINQGNSGGPLVNLDGEVIGINTAVAADAQGIGFAIPINATKGLVKGVLKNGKVQRSYLGVNYLTLTPGYADRLGLSVERGAYVYNQGANPIVPGSPAADAGIKNRDVILSVNGVKVDQNNGLSLLLAQFTPGEEINLNILRGSERRDIKVTLGTYIPR